VSEPEPSLVINVEPQDAPIRQLRVMHRLQDRVWRRGGDSSAVDEKVRHAQAEVDGIRNDIWRQRWAIPYAIAIYWAHART
jgi:hypothetical protein